VPGQSFRIRPCDLSDLEALRNIAWQTYDDTFRHLNKPANMDAYLATAFDRERLQSELGNPHSTFFFLVTEGAVAGYLKLNEADAQTDLRDPGALEIERVYVRRDFQGLGLGKALIEKSLEVARERGRHFVWLGVWEKNGNAIAFYKKMGFSRIGTHAFFMGSERQTDLIMKREVEKR
jgi:ribosomal protein S18 acetylase RimI-like enzyme